MNFINPVPFGFLDGKTTSKKIYYNTYPNDRIVSPSDGIVVNADQGVVTIEHILNGENYYSQLSKLNQINVSSGNRVSKKETIGTSGNDLIEFEIFDSKGNNLVVNDFLYGTFNDKTKKENPEKKEKEKEVIKLDLGSSKDKKRPALYRGFINTITLPFTIAGSALSGNLVKKEKKKKDEESINEEVSRIQKLIKF